LWVNDNIKPKTQKEWNIFYDLKTERICYGLYDHDNNLLGVKGRTETNDVEDKYIYLYPCIKSNILCGIHKTLPHILAEKKCLVFESFKSVMLAWQYGYKFTVSLEGSSPSEWQYRKLLELDSEIIIALDKGVENKKLREIRDRLKGKTKLSFIFDNKRLLKGEKSSPIDEGISKFKYLYDNRFKIN
jgi:DNA primase